MKSFFNGLVSMMVRIANSHSLTPTGSFPVAG